MRLQFVAIEADGASALVQKVPDALRVDLILKNPKEKVPPAGGYALAPSLVLGSDDSLARSRRRLARAVL